jgi:hypothetical protein
MPHDDGSEGLPAELGLRRPRCGHRRPTPPAVKPEALLPEDYDEDVAVARAFVESNAQEDVNWS